MLATLVNYVQTWSNYLSCQLTVQGYGCRSLQSTLRFISSGPTIHFCCFLPRFCLEAEQRYFMFTIRANWPFQKPRELSTMIQGSLNYTPSISWMRYTIQSLCQPLSTLDNGEMMTTMTSWLMMQGSNPYTEWSERQPMAFILLQILRTVN